MRKINRVVGVEMHSFKTVGAYLCSRKAKVSLTEYVFITRGLDV